MWCTEKQEDDDFNDASSMDNHIAGRDFRIVRWINDELSLNVAFVACFKFQFRSSVVE